MILIAVEVEVLRGYTVTSKCILIKKTLTQNIIHVSLIQHFSQK